jgi:hypothetical protein
LERRVETLEAELAALKERYETGLVTHLLNTGHITEARQLVSLLLKVSPTPKLEQWARVLAPPTVREESVASGGSIARNNAWLREHARDYVGKWVALRDGVLVGEDADRVALHRRLEQSGQLEGVFFARL